MSSGLDFAVDGTLLTTLNVLHMPSFTDAFERIVAEARNLMRFKSTFAQNYQDTWFVTLARHVGWLNSPGFYLDLGAYRGFECSNTALLDVLYHWRGVCAEAQEDTAAFVGRTCTLVHRVLGGVSGRNVSMSGRGQVHRIVSPNGSGAERRDTQTRETLSVSDLIACVNGSAAFRRRRVCTNVLGGQPVPSFIHWVSMDLEENEASVLLTWPWHRVTVGVFTIENHPRDRSPSHVLVRNLMREQGYLQVPVENAGVDEYYVLPHLWSEPLARKAWRTHLWGGRGCRRR